MTDLQCPARFLLLTDARQQLVDAAENVHAVVRAAGGPPGDSDITTLRRHLLDLADLYRGETVVVLVDALPDAWSTTGSCAVLIDADRLRVEAWPPP